MRNQPKYSAKIAKQPLPGSENDNSCWNRGLKGHQFSKCKKPGNVKTITAKKLAFMKKGIWTSKYKKNFIPNDSRIVKYYR